MSGSSPLFALPPELRNHIYDILKAEQTDYKTIRITSGSIVLHPLTRTCQQIRKESSPVLQPDNLDDTIWIVVQVFDFKLDALNRILLSLPIPEHRIVMLHTTMMLTAPGAECMVQLHRWLTARRTEALHPLARPRFAFDSLNRFYSAQIDWTTHSLATANSIVNTLTGLKLGNVTKRTRRFRDTLCGGDDCQAASERADGRHSWAQYAGCYEQTAKGRKDEPGGRGRWCKEPSQKCWANWIADRL